MKKGEIEEKILKFLEKVSEASTAEIAKNVCHSQSSVNYALKQLEMKDLVWREAGEKCWIWRIKLKPRALSSARIEVGLPFTQPALGNKKEVVEIKKNIKVIEK